MKRTLENDDTNDKNSSVNDASIRTSTLATDKHKRSKKVTPNSKEEDNSSTTTLDEWCTNHFISLKQLNLKILQEYDFNNNEDLRDNHEQIKLLLDIWNDMPVDDDSDDDDDANESNSNSNNNKSPYSCNERKEVTLYELLQLTGEAHLYSRVNEISNSNNDDDDDDDDEKEEEEEKQKTATDLAIQLLHHAMYIGRVVYVNNEANESMFTILAQLGIAYDRKDMISEAIEHLQLAHAMGEKLFENIMFIQQRQQQQQQQTNSKKKQEGNDQNDSVAAVAVPVAVAAPFNTNYEEFLNRMIAICKTLGELYKSINNVDAAINVYLQADKYFIVYDDDNTKDNNIEQFEEMLKLMDYVGILALEKKGKIDNSIIQHVKLGVELREDHLDTNVTPNSEMLLSSLIILRDLYLRNNDNINATEISKRMIDIKGS